MYHAGTQFACNPHCFFCIICLHSCGQTIFGVVCNRYRFFFGIKWNERNHRTKNFFSGNTHIVVYIAKNSWLYKVSGFQPFRTTNSPSKKSGAFIPGIRPGKNTADYLDYVLTRLTVVGAAYLAAICILPEILISEYQVPFYFGGTSLLIVVTVTMDTVSQIQSHLLAHQYEGLIKKSKLRGKRR